MSAVAAFCAAWALTWGLACFAHAAFAGRWMDAIQNNANYWGVLLLVQALACFAGMLAARGAGA